MRKIKLILMICLIATLSTHTAQAQFPGTTIFPRQLEQNAIVLVEDGESVSVSVSWDACRKALADVAVNVSHIDLWLDGNQLGQSSTAGAGYSNSSQAFQSYKETFNCMGKADVIWGFGVFSYLGTLPLGDHILRVTWEFDHPVQSGADQDGDGRPDLFRGLWLDRTITIRVMPPGAD
jgi:hypothetical protein